MAELNKCKHHGLIGHDVFLSYRVSLHKDLALSLFDMLNNPPVNPALKSSRPPVTVYLDKKCLVRRNACPGT